MQRASRYSQAELDALDFAGEAPDGAVLGRRWHGLLAEARIVVDRLPLDHVGECAFSPDGGLCRLPGAALDRSGDVRFHAGRIGGAMPVFPHG